MRRCVQTFDWYCIYSPYIFTLYILPIYSPKCELPVFTHLHQYEDPGPGVSQLFTKLTNHPSQQPKSFCQETACIADTLIEANCIKEMKQNIAIGNFFVIYLKPLLMTVFALRQSTGSQV